MFKKLWNSAHRGGLEKELNKRRALGRPVTAADNTGSSNEARINLPVYPISGEPSVDHKADPPVQDSGLSILPPSPIS